MALGIILVYDVSDENSFKTIPNWMKQVETYTKPNAIKILVGNKCDIFRVVTEEEGRNLANLFGFGFFETSCKTNKNINEIFIYMAKGILKANKGNLQNYTENRKRYKL